MERLSGVPVETRGAASLPATNREVPQGDPRLRPVADRRHLLGSCVGRPETSFRLVEQPALHQRSSQYELRRADLVEVVLPTLQEIERLARELVCLVVLTTAQVHRGQPTERLCGVRVGVGLQGARERGLQMLDRAVLVAEEQGQPPERAQATADV